MPTRLSTVPWLRQIRDAQRPGVFGAFLAVTLGLLFLVPPLGSLLRNWSYDLSYLFRPEIIPLEAVVVSMDAYSHEKLGQPPGEEHTWHRLLHASLIGELETQGVRAIVFDILIADGWDDKLQTPASRRILTDSFGYEPADLEPAAVDRHLSNAVHRATIPIVFAAAEETVGRKSVLKAPDRILGPRAQYGSYYFPKSMGGIIRRHNCATNLPSLAWRVADLLGQAPPLGSLGLKTTWINYYGPRQTLPYISYATIFEKANTEAILSNRVVYVGKEKVLSGEGPTTGDEFPTPYSLWGGPETPGVEIQATAFLNLYRNEWLRLMSPWTQLAVIVGAGLVVGYVLPLFRPWIAARWAVVGALLTVVLGIGMVWSTLHWLPWLTVAAVQIPVALAWSMFANTKRVYREKEVLEESLATARTGPTPRGMPVPIHGDLSRVDTSVLPPPPSDGPIAPSSPVIPDHQLLRCIGKGAYGEVWLARDIIGSYHAVKIVYRHNFSSESPYLREFRGLQKFTPISRQHPGLVQVLHVGRNEEAGYFYCIMEAGDDETTGQDIRPDVYTPRTLAREIDAQRRLPAVQCIRLGIALADALEFLHQRKLIHRDIKPSNIIYVSDAPKFADIGLVTDIVTGTRRDVSYLGTEGFIPPEGPGTAAADVYSLGKLLYEASMGRDRQQFPELPTGLDQMPDQDVLLELNRIILMACESDATQRYQHAADLRRELEALQAQLDASG